MSQTCHERKSRIYEYTLDPLPRSGSLTALAVFEQLVKGDTTLGFRISGTKDRQTHVLGGRDHICQCVFMRSPAAITP